MVINYEEYFEQAGLVDIQTAIPGVVVDLKYATADNFMGEILYPDLRKAYLLPHMISRLARVHARLQELKPGYRLVIYDAARPLSIQRRMFERVRGKSSMWLILTMREASIITAWLSIYRYSVAMASHWIWAVRMIFLEKKRIRSTTIIY